jgi:hypothetical protein
VVSIASCERHHRQVLTYLAVAEGVGGGRHGWTKVVEEPGRVLLLHVNAMAYV